MTDEEIEGRLFTYWWLAMKTINSHGASDRAHSEQSRRCEITDWKTRIPKNRSVGSERP
jgi:hypothetical protein